MRAKLLLVVVFILVAPLISRSVRRELGSVDSFVCVAQDPNGGHGEATGGGSPTPPQSPTSLRIDNGGGRRAHTGPGTPVSGGSDFGSGLATGLMALGVGLLFWLRMR